MLYIMQYVFKCSNILLQSLKETHVSMLKMLMISLIFACWNALLSFTH